jgi:hypothetical protein
MSTTRIRMAGIGLALAAALAAGGVAAPALAATQETPAPTATQDQARAELLKQRLSLACARIPNLVTRTENLQTRLAADASTPGSIAWLEAKAAKAQAAGRDELAAALTARVAVRTELADLLPLRLEALDQAEQACTKAGL